MSKAARFFDQDCTTFSGNHGTFCAGGAPGTEASTCAGGGHVEIVTGHNDARSFF